MYEFAFAHSFDPSNHSAASFWQPESLCVEDEEWGIGVLSDTIQSVFPDPPGFGWYGVTQVSLEPWERIETLTRGSHPHAQDVDAFFTAVRAWLDQGSHGADCFWILGP